MCSLRFALMSVLYGKSGVTGALDLVGGLASRSMTYKGSHIASSEMHKILHSHKAIKALATFIGLRRCHDPELTDTRRRRQSRVAYRPLHSDANRVLSL